MAEDSPSVQVRLTLAAAPYTDRSVTVTCARCDGKLRVRAGEVPTVDAPRGRTVVSVTTGRRGAIAHAVAVHDAGQDDIDIVVGG